MPIMRYKLIGTNMMERPTKGEWVRWDDVKMFTSDLGGTYTSIKLEEDNNETTSDNKRSRK